MNGNLANIAAKAQEFTATVATKTKRQELLVIRWDRLSVIRENALHEGKLATTASAGKDN